MPSDDGEGGRQVGLDPLLLDRNRLAIALFLLARGTTRFKALQDGLGLTSGNLASHLRRLEEAGYVKTARTLPDARARVVRITPQELGALQTMIDRLRSAVERAGSEHPSRDRNGP